MRLLKKCLLAAVLCAVAIIPAMLSAGAVEPLHNASDEYLNSPYHAQLQSVELTGDQATDVVLVALSQLGYHEGNSDADMGGLSSGTRDFVEYNRLYGKLDNNQGNGVSYGYSWCCSFATWCVKHAGVSTSVVKTEVSCDRLVDWLTANSTYKTRDSGYVPKTGDLIFFKTAGSSRRHASHVGIVMWSDGTRVYTVEGNTSTYNVTVRDYACTDSYIVGYGVPEYASRPSAAIDFSQSRTGTHFISVTSSALNVRKGPATSYDIVGSVSYADKVTVTEVVNGWGKISLSGTEGWIYLGYTWYVPSARYTVYFDTNGGTPTTMPTVPKQDGKAAVLPESIPARTGYSFAGWATKKDAKVAEYSPGGSFELDADTTLYAVWSVGNYTVSFYYEDTLLQTGEYAHGVIVNKPTAPVKSADKTYEYTFAGWDTNGDGKVDVLPDGNVTASSDLVCRAVFDKKYVEYTVVFKGYGDSTISETKYHYGDTVKVPEVAAVVEGKYKYVFEGWNAPVVSAVEANATYTATYKQELATYKVKFVGDGGAVISEAEYYYGDSVVVPAELPLKKADETYTYEFSAWAPTVAAVSADAVYTAQFKKTYIDYTVRFLDGDGKEVEVSTYHYGEVPTLKYEGLIQKTEDETYTYTFRGWDKEFVGITGDTVFTALFDSTKRIYTVTFFDEDGSVISTADYNYGDEIKSPTPPKREGYSFEGWSPELGTVSGNMSFKAVYKQVEQVTTPPAEPPAEPDDEQGLPVGLLISLAVVLLAAAGFVVFIILRRKRTESED